MAIIEAGPRLDVTTLNALVRKVIAPIYPQDYLLDELMKRGRMTKRNGGKKVEWRMEFRRRTPTPINGYPENLTFQSTNSWKEASLPYREYAMGERIDKFEKLAQQSGGSDVTPTAIIPIVESVTKKLSKDFVFGLAQEMMKDGNSGSANTLHGFESWNGVSSTVSNSAFGNPSDTYAGISTALGNYGGEWTPGSGYGWPHGYGDADYYFASPLIVDYNNENLTSTDATSSTRSWFYQWESAIRMLTTYGEVLQHGHYDALLLDPELFRIARDSLTDRTRFVATSSPGNTSVGYKTYDFEGLKIVTQYGVTSGCGYAIRFDNLELRSMLGQLVEVEKDFDLSSNSDQIALRSYLQLVCESPAYQGKLAAISSEGT